MFLVLVRVSTEMETFLVLPTPTLNTPASLMSLAHLVLFPIPCDTSHRTLLAYFDFDFCSNALSLCRIRTQYPRAFVASLSVSLFARF